MSSRPRRSAAAKASETISVQTRIADESERQERGVGMASRRSGRSSGAMATESSRGSTARAAARSGATTLSQEQLDGTEVVHGTRNRGGRKNYVVDSSPDDDEEEEEADIEDDEEEDGEGDEDMDVDGEEEEEEEEDAEGDIDMEELAASTRPTIKVFRKAGAVATLADDDNDDLSDPGDSDPDNNMDLNEVDAEGEEIEVAGEEDEDEEGEEDEDEDDEDEEEEGDEDGEADEDEEDEENEIAEANGDAPGGLDSDDDGSRAVTPDVSKMTKRQRARFEDEPHEFMKLSDEVQVKKHFTAEELSMRRQEMARRRRNLSEKRNEEVKMETINKLLKKQAPKLNRKAAAQATAAANEEMNGEFRKPDSILIRWVNNKDGSRVAVPDEIVAGPAGQVFMKGNALPVGKMIDEVS